MAGRTYPQACADKNLFLPWFDGDSWSTWRVLDKAIFGIPLVGSELETFRELCGNREPPTAPATEVWLALGRRAGKDVKAASIAVYLATIGAEMLGYRKHLTRGERGVIQILALDRDQAKIAFNYAAAFFEIPMLAPLVRRITADTIELTNNLAIEVTTADKRRVRGRTVCCAILDEIGHWKSESTISPDLDVYRAIKPAMMTIPNALLIGISSVHARRGLLWQKHADHFGKDGAVLCARAPTWVMNPTQPRDGEFIAGEYAKDPAYAAAEYGSEWRTDVEAYVSLEAVKACIKDGVRERRPERRWRYVGFADPSGGSSDSMTLAVAHREADTVILDCLRERKPPFSPEGVVEEFSDLLRSYRVSRVYGDRYGGEWPREQFKKRGIYYVPSELTKSELYVDLLPLLNSGAADLLDNDTLVSQLVSLERTTTRGSRDKVDHPKGLHDDLANSCAGALVTAMSKLRVRELHEYQPVQVEPWHGNFDIHRP